MTNSSAALLQNDFPLISGIVDRSPADLTQWPGNPRKHSDKQKAKLKAAIRKFGFTSVVVTDEYGVILSGHCRAEVATDLGLPTIPTRVISGLTEAQKCAFVIADNKLGELSKWDDVKLKAELEILMHAQIEIEVTGFSTAEIDLIFGEPSETVAIDPGDLQPEDLPAEIVSRLGDLWLLGSHRLHCGNALDPKCYQKLTQNQPVQMVFTDPPYNVPIQGHVCGKGKVRHKEFAMASGEMSRPEFTGFLRAALEQMHACVVDGAIVYICMDWRHLQELLCAGQPLFGDPRQLCVWVKDNGGMGTFYRSQHELIGVYKKGDASHINNFELGQHGRYRTNVWNYPGANTFSGNGREILASHPTPKPVSLVADAIRDCSHHKGIILDPFCGSGTILIAAERTGRHALAMELEPHYIDVSLLRWQRFSGEEAILEATGQTWSQVRAERLSEGREASHGL